MTFTEEQIANQIAYIKEQQAKAEPALRKLAIVATIAGINLESVFGDAVHWTDEMLRARAMRELKAQEIKEHNRKIEEQRNAKRMEKQQCRTNRFL
jgi:hypothetical protein